MGRAPTETWHADDDILHAPPWCRPEALQAMDAARRELDPFHLVSMLACLPRLGLLSLEATRVGEEFWQLAAERLPGPAVLRMLQ